MIMINQFDQVEYIVLIDESGLQAYFDTQSLVEANMPVSFTVQGTRIDTLAPTLYDIVIVSHLVNLTTVERQNVTLVISIEGWCVCLFGLALCNIRLVAESVSGLASFNETHEKMSQVQVSALWSPSNQLVTAFFDETNLLPSDAPIVKGISIFSPKPTRLYAVNITLPVYAWPGDWKVSLLYLVDAAGNDAEWDYNELSDRSTQHRMSFGVVNLNQTFIGFDDFDYKACRQGFHSTAHPRRLLLRMTGTTTTMAMATKRRRRIAAGGSRCAVCEMQCRHFHAPPPPGRSRLLRSAPRPCPSTSTHRRTVAASETPSDAVQSNAPLILASQIVLGLAVLTAVAAVCMSGDKGIKQQVSLRRRDGGRNDDLVMANNPLYKGPAKAMKPYVIGVGLHLLLLRLLLLQ